VWMRWGVSTIYRDFVSMVSEKIGHGRPKIGVGVDFI
jgi:hypothetical protein